MRAENNAQARSDTGIRQNGDSMMQHPYLTFSAEDAKRYFEERLKRPDGDEFYSSLNKSAEKALKEEFVTEARAGSDTVSQHSDYGLLNRQAFGFFYSLGLKYLIDRDERCAARIKELLLSFIGFERWHSDSYSKRAPVAWHSDLCSTLTAFACAQLYDLIFDALTDNERKTISRGILEKGVYPALRDWVLPETRIHALDSMGHNWWAVCIGESACAFLCVSDFVPDRERDRVVSLADEALAAYLRYGGNAVFNKIRNFDSGGLFYEGTGYSAFGTGWLLQYLYCRERYYGRCDTIRSAIPEGLCDADAYLCYPYTRDGAVRYGYINFCDSSFDHDPGPLGAFACLNCIDTPAMRAMARFVGPDTVREIAGFYPDRLEGSLTQLPKSAFFSSGVAVHRTSWQPDATLFAFRCGSCWNHSHNDSGSFVIYHRGRRLFTDDGTCGYDHPEYHGYYCQDAAHSTIFIGGKGRRHEELYRGTKFPAVFTDGFIGEDLFFAQADCAGPMAHLASRLFRNFFVLDGRVLVIFDDILAHEEDTAQLTLHFEGKYRGSDGSLLFENGDAKARFTVYYPEKTWIGERTGHHDQAEKTPAPYIEISTEEKLRTHLIISVIELDHDSHDMKIEPLFSDGAAGLRLTEAGREREIWFNRYADGHIMHDNTINVLAGYETDAYMLVVTKDASGGKKILAVCASCVRDGEKALFSSFAKKTAETEVDK